MSYIGNAPPKLAQYGVESFNGGGTSFTLSKPATTATVLVFIDGVRQTPGDAYSVSGTTLTTTATTPSGTDNVTVQFLGDVVDFGEPSDDSVTSAKIVDGTIVNADINASAAIALSKLASDPSNASNLASGTVPTARLGSGTASSSVFLRGDQSWASAGSDAYSANASASTGAVNIDASNNLQFNSGYGSTVTAYGCRAWVNFNGSGTVAIRDSANVSSITDNGTGDFTINFSTSMPDANYVTIGSTGWDPITFDSTGGPLLANETLSTASVRIATGYTYGVGYFAATDWTQNCVAIIR